MRIRPRIQVALALILVIGLASLAIPPAKAVVIYEYGMAGTPIPWSMTIDKDGAIWITEQGTNKIAKLYGGIFEWSIPTPGAVPWGITCSKDHADIWFTEETQGKIGKFSPSYPGVFYEWTLPDPLNARPRGIAMNITKLSNGNKTPANSVWFTLFQKHRIGYMYVDNANQATFSFYPLPDDDTYPMDIVMSPIDYSVWFTEYGTGQIGSIKLLDDGSALIKHYATSATNSKPWGIAVDPKGFVWITESATNCLGRLNPASGEYVTFTLPTPNAEPRGLAIEAYTTQPYDVINVWFTEYNSDKIGRYNPSMNVFYEYSVITTGSRPYGIAVTGPGGNVWFTEPFAQKIGYLYQGNPIVSYTTVGTITSALTTSMTSSVVRTTTASTTTAAAAAISAVMSTTAPVTTVTMTQTFTSSKMYMTSTSIYSYTLTSRSTSYTTSTSTTTYTQVSISTSTLSTSTTTIATSTSFIVETSTFQTSRTDTIVLTSTSLTTNTLTMTSTSIYPTVTATAMNTSFMITTTFSPTITVTSFQTSVVPTTSTVTSFLSTTTTTTTSVAITRPCVIASAAYGSELAPEVQFLRGFRDKSVTSTFAGGQFMKVFNEFYYSFSPSVARFTASSQQFSAGVRMLIYPLIASLHVAASVYQALLPFNMELAIVLSGTLASCLIGLAYISPIVLVRSALRRRRKAAGGK